MNPKRFINIDGEVLYDKSGKMEAIYHNEKVYFPELCDFLNEMDDELTDYKIENNNLRNKVDTLQSGNILLKATLDSYRKVMSKYEIGSVEKLDRILMEQKVW